GATANGIAPNGDVPCACISAGDSYLKAPCWMPRDTDNTPIRPTRRIRRSLRVTYSRRHRILGVITGGLLLAGMHPVLARSNPNKNNGDGGSTSVSTAPTTTPTSTSVTPTSTATTSSSTSTSPTATSTTSTSGPVFYVSPGGSGDCSQAKPCGSVTTAFNA